MFKSILAQTWRSRKTQFKYIKKKGLECSKSSLVPLGRVTVQNCSLDDGNSVDNKDNVYYFFSNVFIEAKRREYDAFIAYGRKELRKT